MKNLDDKKSKGTHWISLFIDRNTTVYFDPFGTEYIPHEILNKISDKLIARNIFRIQDNDSIMCGFYCIAFIEYMLAEKTLLHYTNLFSPNGYEKNSKIIYKYFKEKYVKSQVYTEKKDETMIYLLDELKHNDLMSGKYKKTCRYLNYVEHFLILASTVTGCVSIFAFPS